MTGLLHERELSRKTFLKGGALVLGFTLGGGLAGRAAAAYQPPLGDYGPDVAELDTWFAVGQDGSVTLYTGVVELGTGSVTGLMQIAAEELDVPFGAMKVVTPDTLRTPDQFVSSGSRAISQHGPPIRQAAAEARQFLVNLAAGKLGVPASQLTVSDGVVSGGGKSISYGELIGGRLFNARITGTAKPKTPDKYRIVGTSVPRVDFPSIAAGTHQYIQNFRLPGMVYGRIIRPPSQGASLVKVNGFKQHVTGVVKVVRKHDWLGVVAESDWEAIVAARALDATWSDWSGLPPEGNLHAVMRTLPLYDAAANPLDLRVGAQYKNPNPNVWQNTGNADAAIAAAPKKLSVTYTTPFLAHGSIGPSAAVAVWQGDRCTVWTSTQTPYGTREAIAKFWGVPNNNVRLISAQGSGTYGQNGSDDAALDATIMARELDRPVRVQWMRWDEHTWENYKSARVYDLSGALDANGKIVAWKSESWGFTNYGRPEYHEPAHGGEPGSLFVAQLAGWTGASVEEGGGPQSAPPFPIPNVWAKHNFLGAPSQRKGALRIKSGSMRNPTGFYDTYANESFIDELAALAGIDALQFRLNHLTSPRAITALQTVAQAAKWDFRPGPNPNRGKGPILRGRGVTVQGNIAEVFEVEVSTKTGKVFVPRVTVAADHGLVVNPNALTSQIEGAVTFGLSNGLYEQVRFDRQKVTSRDWVTYPIMRYKDSPPVIDTVLINRPDQPSTGGGEPPHQPVLAGLANAIFDATGVRMRDLPFTPKKVLAALRSAGY
ncbi:MAG TPA: molybdopterin cofactor-binding domain-containing protein [Gaiellaceae bacterium]|nr:molybdopterin cofactor-binding domain-containing protein [Gaiellaceae bacterium]